MKGPLQYLLLTLRLNFRSRQALIYGYLVPIFFLLAFGSVFRSTVPPLMHEMGQLLTITVLGGACFGMPTAMVSERERGVWRRYRLLPASTAGLITSAMVARYLIVVLAAVMQIALAWCLYRTPLPAHPAQLVVAFTAVCFAFLGMGLIIAMIAKNVPAVQALGQAIFLPMIMIGGVGVPLRSLPAWARNVAGFLPGRYAVEALRACILQTSHGLADARFALAALAAIGAAACVAGAKLFRWDSSQKASLGAKGWLVVALAAWLGVGLAAWSMNRLDAPADPTSPGSSGGALKGWESITEKELGTITYTDLPDDDGDVTPFAGNLDQADRISLDAFRSRLAAWEPGRVRDIGQRVRNLLCVCSIADLAEDPNEAEIPRVIFEQLQQSIPRDQLRKALGWIVLHPGDGNVVLSVPELDVDGTAREPRLRERCALYAKKMLLRLKNL